VLSRGRRAGYAPSQASLGRLFVQGRGVIRNDAEAVQWLTLAVKQNEPSALFNLAMMGIAGVGCAPNPRGAAEMLRQAAFSASAPRRRGWRFAICAARA
jgi:TPR repeat protein